MDLSWTTFAGIALGIGLAAATGFRVFLPLLVAGVAGHFGYIPLSENFQWLASMPALVMLGTAAAAEILAYYIPGVDHALDVVASPATLVAGVPISLRTEGDTTMNNQVAGTLIDLGTQCADPMERLKTIMAGTAA